MLKDEYLDIEEDRHILIKADIMKYVLDPDTAMINASELARKYDVSVQDVRKAKQEIIKNIDVYAVKKAKKEFSVAFDKLMEHAESLFDNISDNEDKRRSMKSYTDLMAARTKFMEDFHMKSKAVEQNNVAVTQKQIVVDMSDSVLDLVEKSNIKRNVTVEAQVSEVDEVIFKE